MSGSVTWLPGLDPVTGAYTLAIWAAVLAVAGLVAGLAILSLGRRVPLGSSRSWRSVAALALAAVLVWLAFDRAISFEQAAARRAFETRLTHLTAQALAPGSPLACIEAGGNASIERACEKALFASAQQVSAALAYADTAVTLLADGLALSRRQPGYEARLERLRRWIEIDRFGLIGHALMTRGCDAARCPEFALLRDARRVAANIRERAFEAQVVLHAANWPAAEEIASAPTSPPVSRSAAPPSPAPPAMTSSVKPPAGSVTAPVAGRYDFPSSDSIPAISIMDSEPSLPSGEPAAAKPAPRPTVAPAPGTTKPASSAPTTGAAPASR